MKIGIAIPCYKGHIQHLSILFDSIENQTVLPDKVVVSCSSTEDDVEFIKTYRFPFEIVVTPEFKNTAQNRNIAAAHLMDMDYISFFDADDIMHPQRIEFILKSIELYSGDNGVDILLHDYTITERIHSYLDCSFQSIETMDSIPNCLCQCPGGCVIFINEYSNYNNNNIDDFKTVIHHSQVTVKSHIMNFVRFSEKPEDDIREDCLFCHAVIGLHGISNVYINHELSLYCASGTSGTLA